MITEENFKEVVCSMDEFDKKRVLKSEKEYCVLYLNVFNAGHSVAIALTDAYDRYKNVSDNGNAIVLTSEVQDVLKEEAGND